VAAAVKLASSYFLSRFHSKGSNSSTSRRPETNFKRNSRLLPIRSERIRGIRLLRGRGLLR